MDRASALVVVTTVVVVAYSYVSWLMVPRQNPNKNRDSPAGSRAVLTIIFRLSVSRTRNGG